MKYKVIIVFLLTLFSYKNSIAQTTWTIPGITGSPSGTSINTAGDMLFQSGKKLTFKTNLTSKSFEIEHKTITLLGRNFGWSDFGIFTNNISFYGKQFLYNSSLQFSYFESETTSGFSGTPTMSLDKNLVKIYNSLTWGSNSSELRNDQGGSLELGAGNALSGIGTPYIDFHYNGLVEDFNARIINDRNKQITFQLPPDGQVKIIGQLELNSANSLNKWVFHMPNDNRKTLYLAPIDASGAIWANQFQFRETGQMHIGGQPINHQDARLSVKGKFVAQSAYITDVSQWSDHVFKSNFKLDNLEHVEKYISNNGHLKDIPSESEILEKGFSVADMDSKLLQKIEELYLYTIQLNKEINILKQDIRTCKKSH